jgi:hypothetical protein
MRNKRQMIPAVGLLGIAAFAVYTVAQLSGQTAAVTGDFTNAARAEVKDAQGQIILRGHFQLADEEDDDIERKATLESTGVDADAAGDAEVEFAKNAPAQQEVEFSVRNVAPGETFTFVIDGTDVGTAKADAKGRAELEIDVRIGGTSAASEIARNHRQ